MRQGERLVYALVDEDQDAGTTVVLRDLGERAEDFDQCAPYGHGAVLEAGTALVVSRADDGGVAIAAVTPRPSWATSPGDVYMATSDGVGVRVSKGSGSPVIETRGAPVTLGVDGAGVASIARSGDACARVAAMQVWMDQVTTALNGLAPGSVTPYTGDVIATVTATSQHKASD